MTTRNFILTTTTTTTLPLQIKTNVIRRRQKITRDFLFPDEVSTNPPKEVKFFDSNVLDAVERSRRPQTFSIVAEKSSIEISSTAIPTTTARNKKRIRFVEKRKSDGDLSASASENLEIYKDLSRYLTFS